MNQLPIYDTRDLSAFAMQFEGTVASALEIAGHMGDQGMYLRSGAYVLPPWKWVNASASPDEWLLELPSGTAYAGAGDWIVLTIGRAELYAVPDALFQALFARVENEDGD